MTNTNKENKDDANFTHLLENHKKLTEYFKAESTDTKIILTTYLFILTILITSLSILIVLITYLSILTMLITCLSF